MSADTDRTVQLGFVAGIYGVKGWLKIHSFTDPRDKISQYPRWIVEQKGQQRFMHVDAGRVQGKSVIAKLQGVETREHAAEFVGAEIFVAREDLPACGPGEYYWIDLEGLLVKNKAGIEFGRIAHMLATGAHDVMVLEGAESRMIPFVLDEIVSEIDLENRIVVVDWDASYWEQ